MWETFATTAQKHLYIKLVWKFFLDFPIPASLANPYRWFTNWLGLLESLNLRKTCSKLHVKLLLWPKLPTYFDDITTIENNRQVRVNIDATLVAIFRIMWLDYVMHSLPSLCVGPSWRGGSEFRLRSGTVVTWPCYVVHLQASYWPSPTCETWWYAEKQHALLWLWIYVQANVYHLKDIMKAKN